MVTVTQTGGPGMTLTAEIDTCLGVAVDETPSLVGRDGDKGFLGRPRDVYILPKNGNTEHSPCGKRGHPEDPQLYVCRPQTPLRARDQGPLDTWLMDTLWNQSRGRG